MQPIPDTGDRLRNAIVQVPGDGLAQAQQSQLFRCTMKTDTVEKVFDFRADSLGKLELLDGLQADSRQHDPSLAGSAKQGNENSLIDTVSGQEIVIQSLGRKLAQTVMT